VTESACAAHVHCRNFANERSSYQYGSRGRCGACVRALAEHGVTCTVTALGRVAPYLNSIFFSKLLAFLPSTCRWSPPSHDADLLTVRLHAPHLSPFLPPSPPPAPTPVLLPLPPTAQPCLCFVVALCRPLSSPFSHCLLLRRHLSAFAGSYSSSTPLLTIVVPSLLAPSSPVIVDFELPSALITPLGSLSRLSILSSTFLLPPHPFPVSLLSSRLYPSCSPHPYFGFSRYSPHVPQQKRPILFLFFFFFLCFLPFSHRVRLFQRGARTPVGYIDAQHSFQVTGYLRAQDYKEGIPRDKRRPYFDGLIQRRSSGRGSGEVNAQLNRSPAMNELRTGRSDEARAEIDRAEAAQVKTQWIVSAYATS